MRCIPQTFFIIISLGIAQQPQSASQSPHEIIQKIVGTDATSQIAYALISTPGELLGQAAPTIPPRLTAQCTRDPSGKLRFELLADFGNIPEITFYPPWKSSPDDLYPPRLDKLQLTMEFLGYTRVKPVKRQWEYLQQPAGELRYSTPGMASANMEPITFYLQYLRALPTLHLTAPGKGTLEFETTKWQEALKSEPLCHASSL